MDGADLAADRLACTRCIGDDGLRADAGASGFAAECAYCGREGTCVDVAWLADRVHPAFQRAFAPVDEQRDGREHAHAEPAGSAPAEAAAADAASTASRLDGARAVAELAGLDAFLARDVHRTLVELFRDEDGGAMYPAGRAYRERPARALPALHDWTAFAAAAARSRPGEDDDLLDALKWAFAGLDALATPKGRRALRRLATGKRAFAASVGERGDAPEPATPAAAGPLNAAGTPTLRLALRERTAVTESLAPRGAQVVVTRVRLARAVRVLDLDAARKALARSGCIDPDRAGSRLRARFLDGLAEALRDAAAWQADESAWRGTQRIGDWLAHAASPRIDGMLVRASHAPGRMLVLFAPATTTGAVVAARVRRYAVDELRARYRRLSSTGPRTRGPRTPPARD